MTEAFTERPPVILVVEDEVLIRDLIEETLKEAGFGVATAATASDAVRLLETNGEYRALITDIDLEEKHAGWAVARRARELHPDIPVLYVTGGSTNDWSANGVPGSVLIAKPFAPAQIVTAVSQLLNTGAAPPA